MHGEISVLRRVHGLMAKVMLFGQGGDESMSAKPAMSSVSGCKGARLADACCLHLVPVHSEHPSFLHPKGSAGVAALFSAAVQVQPFAI